MFADPPTATGRSTTARTRSQHLSQAPQKFVMAERPGLVPAPAAALSRPSSAGGGGSVPARCLVAALRRPLTHPSWTSANAAATTGTASRRACRPFWVSLPGTSSLGNGFLSRSRWKRRRSGSRPAAGRCTRPSWTPVTAPGPAARVGRGHHERPPLVGPDPARRQVHPVERVPLDAILADQPRHSGGDGGQVLRRVAGRPGDRGEVAVRRLVGEEGHEAPGGRVPILRCRPSCSNPALAASQRVSYDVGSDDSRKRETPLLLRGCRVGQTGLNGEGAIRTRGKVSPRRRFSKAERPGGKLYPTRRFWQSRRPADTSTDTLPRTRHCDRRLGHSASPHSGGNPGIGEQRRRPVACLTGVHRPEIGRAHV